MARSVRATIETRSARLRLVGRKEPYWVKLERGLSLGYYRSFNGSAGTWHARVRVAGRYRSGALETADDHLDANGETILNWSQAQAAARTWAAAQTSAGPLTVERACLEYVADLRARKGDQAANQVEGRLRKNLFPVLGTRLLAKLSAADLADWRNGLVDVEGDADEIRRSRDTSNRAAWHRKGRVQPGLPPR
jgi:hypothetical protein